MPCDDNRNAWLVGWCCLGRCDFGGGRWTRRRRPKGPTPDLTRISTRTGKKIAPCGAILGGEGGSHICSNHEACSELLSWMPTTMPTRPFPSSFRRCDSRATFSRRLARHRTRLLAPVQQWPRLLHRPGQPQVDVAEFDGHHVALILLFLLVAACLGSSLCMRFMSGCSSALTVSMVKLSCTSPVTLSVQMVHSQAKPHGAPELLPLVLPALPVRFAARRHGRTTGNISEHKRALVGVTEGTPVAM
jgi:hypothetical protein